MIREISEKPPAASFFSRAGRFAEQVLDLLFPPTCIVCQRLGEWLCADCVSRIERICPPLCCRCGLPLSVAAGFGGPPCDPTQALCRACRRSPPQLDGLRSFGYHTGPLRTAIHRLKYDNLRALARPLGELMAGYWKRDPAYIPGADAIVPVPLHVARHRDRGYNQAALLARELGAGVGLPVVEDGLTRTRATAPQVGLSIPEREANVSGAFECSADTLAGMKVLLVDDVFTTGCTLGAACSALKDAGASSVWAYTLARARPHENLSYDNP